MSFSDPFVLLTLTARPQSPNSFHPSFLPPFLLSFTLSLHSPIPPNPLPLPKQPNTQIPRRLRLHHIILALFPVSPQIPRLPLRQPTPCADGKTQIHPRDLVFHVPLHGLVLRVYLRFFLTEAGDAEAGGGYGYYVEGCQVRAAGSGGLVAGFDDVELFGVLALLVDEVDAEAHFVR